MGQYRIELIGDASNFRAEARTAVAAVASIEQQSRTTSSARTAMGRRELTEVEVLEAAKRKAIAETNRDRIAAAQQQMRSAQEAGNAEAGAMNVAAIAGGQFKDMLMGLVGQFTLMAGASAIVSVVAHNMELARDAAREGAKYVTDLRGQLREITAMKGEVGNTGPEVLSNLKTRAQTLQTAEEVRAFQETMVGSGASAVGRLISQTEFDKLGLMVGKFQAAEGGAASTHGQLAGMLPILQGKPATAEEDYAKFQQLYAVMQPGGASFTSGINQLLKVSPLTTAGVYKDISQEAALLSAFSLTNREGAGENVLQFTRATAGALGKTGAPRIEGDTQKLGRYLAGLGANNQMQPQDIGKLISQDFVRQEGFSKAKGQTFAPLDYLKHHGYLNQEDMLSLMQFHGFYKGGAAFDPKAYKDMAGDMTPDKAKMLAELSKAGGANLFSLFEGIASKPADGGKVGSLVNTWAATDPNAQQRKADVAGDIAKFNVGAGPNEYFENLRRSVFEKEKATPGSKFYGKYEDWRDHQWGGKQKLNQATYAFLIDQEKKTGTFKKGEEQFLPDRWNRDNVAAKEAYEMGTRIAGVPGGQMMPNLDPLVKLAEDQLRVAEQMRDAYLKANPPPAPKPTPTPLPGGIKNWSGRPP